MQASARRLLIILLFGATSSALAQPPPPPPPPPPPLGAPPQPAGNPVTVAKANLGKVLFYEEQLSSTRTVACATCHHTGHGGTDPRALIGDASTTNPGLDGVLGTPDDVTASRGVPLSAADGTYQDSATFGLQDQVTPRKSPSSVNAAYPPLLFWDGRATGNFTDPQTGAVVLPVGGALESQSVGPPVSSTEMAHVGRNWNDVVARLTAVSPLVLSPAVPAALSAWMAGRSYPQLFEEAFGTPEINSARIAMAIASYERTLFSNQTPFDALLGGQLNALTPQENNGRALFGVLGCAGCHAGSLTSDNLFHYIGTRPVGEDLGRFAISGNPGDRGAFRTPSLRNVELRAPYFHSGRFGTLEEVVDFYNRGGDFNAPNKPPVIRPLGLTAQQKADLVAFLKRPLTDPRVAAEQAPFDEVVLYMESDRVPQITGTGVAGSGGFVPQPEAIEPPLAGNNNFTVGLFGALGATAAVLVIDSADPGAGPTVPETASFARIEVPVSGVGPGDGFASVSLTISDGPGIVGATFFGRWYVADPSAPDNIAVTPAFRFTVFGPAATASDAPPAPARVATLYPNSPNPFNPETKIRYELTAASPVRLAIFDASGRVVRHLESAAAKPAGLYELRWNGRDDTGAAVASGVYLYRLQAGSFEETRRAVLLK